MKISLKVEHEWKESEIYFEPNDIRWSVENEIIQSIKMWSYLLAWEFSKQNGREQKDWIDTLEKRKDGTNTITLTPEELHTVRMIFKDCIATPFYYIQPNECLDGEVGLLNVRIIAKQ